MEMHELSIENRSVRRFRQEIVLEETDGNIRYYRDKEDRHHVPKLALGSLIVPVKD